MWLATNGLASDSAYDSRYEHVGPPIEDIRDTERISE